MKMNCGILSTLVHACLSRLSSRRRINITETRITHALHETLGRPPTSDEVDLFLNHLLENTGDWVNDMAQNFIEDVSEVASVPYSTCSHVNEPDQGLDHFFSPAAFSPCPSNCPFKTADDVQTSAERLDDIDDKDRSDFGGIIPR
jgi:hypothetical protein